MSSAVISTSAALGRPFVFEDEAEPEVGSLQGSRGDTRPRLSSRVQLDSNDPAAKILPSSVVPASHLSIRPAPEMVSSGIPALDTLTGGLPRGCLTEICGSASSGRTSLLLAALAAATHRGEFCALVDASDSLDPQSAASSGVDLDHLLWVRCGDSPPQRTLSSQRHFSDSLPQFSPSVILRVAKDPLQVRSGSGFSRSSCHDSTSSEFHGVSQRSPKGNSKNRNQSDAYQSEHRLEQVLRATDLLLESGGFGLIVLDLADLPAQAARRIPLTTWFRFRRAVENKPTILLAIEQHPIAGSCSSLLLQLEPANNESEASAQNSLFGIDEPAAEERKKFSSHELDLSPHAHLLTGLNITTELIRSRIDRKPARSITFATKTAWAG